MIHISIEGMDGVGKSTTCTLLADRLGYKLIEKPLDYLLDNNIEEYRKLAKALNIDTVYYIYIFNDWFENQMYKDMLDYIKSVDGCDYIFYHKGEDILCH